MIKGNIDPSIPNKSEVIQSNNDLFGPFDGGSSDSFDKSRTVINILLFSIMIIAKQIASTNDKDKPILNKKFDSIFKLQIEKFIIIKNIKTT